MSPIALLRVSTLPIEMLSPLRAARVVPLVEELIGLEEALDHEAAALSGALHAAAGEREALTEPEHASRRLALVHLKRDVHNARPLREADLAGVRGRVQADLMARLEGHAGRRRRRDELLAASNEALVADVAAARRALLALAADPLVEEGVRLASRALPARLRALAGREPSGWGHDDRHLAAKAVAYLARFCTKTSPNGLFCATALAEIGGEETALEGRPEIERVDVILSVAEARKVAACLAADEAARPAIVPRPNPTLQEGEGAWTFWKPASPRNPTDEEVLSRVKDHPVLRAFLEEAAQGGRSAPMLLDAVAARCQADPEELDAFYGQLVERGILIGEIEIPYNSRRPLRDLAGACRAASCEAAWLRTVEEVEATVDDLPRLGPAERDAAAQRIVRALEALPHTRPLKPDEMLRLDAASALKLRLPSRVLEDLRGGVRLYARLFAAMYPERIYREALAARFLDRHPPNADVGLLDLYHGLFEPQERRRPVAFPEPGRVARGAAGSAGAQEALTRAREHFVRLAREACPGDEVALDEEDLAAALGGLPEPRWACGVLFHVAARDVGDIGEGHYRLVLSAIFQGAGLALARFASLHGGNGSPEDNPVVRELKRGWSAVRREGAIVAELTYNHDARTANAGLRPAIFRYEIELPGEKASPGAEAVPLRDLVLRWDSEEERFVLRWPARGVEVIPVINSGVNPVGFISFLVGIGQQGLQPVGHFPGFEAEGVTRWPRFVSGKVVLFRERWTFRPGEWPGSSRGRSLAPPEELFLEAARWRHRHRLPRHVFVHSSADPKPRYMDLESPLFTDLLQRTAAEGEDDRARELHVTEILPGPDDLWISGPKGRYASELLVHLQEPGPEGETT